MRPSVSPEVLRQVRLLELRTRRLVDTLASGDSRAVFRGQGIEFAEVRPYSEGDDHRRIDWNVSARFAAPFVKTFTEERERALLLVLDRSASTGVGDPRPAADRAAELATVLALAGARAGDRVGALIFAERPLATIPLGKGHRHALRIVRDLLAQPPVPGGTGLADALGRAARLLRHRALVVVVSDFVAEGWEAPFRRLALRHDVVACALESPRDRAVPPVGWLTAADAEGGGRALVRLGAAGRAAAAAALARRREARDRAIVRAGADLLVVDTADDYAGALQRLFAERARRRR